MKNMDMIIILKSANYHLWKNKMEDPFFVKKIPHYLKKKNQIKTDEKWKLLHHQMCGWYLVILLVFIVNHLSVHLGVYIAFAYIFAYHMGGNALLEVCG